MANLTALLVAVLVLCVQLAEGVRKQVYSPKARVGAPGSKTRSSDAFCEGSRRQILLPVSHDEDE